MNAWLSNPYALVLGVLGVCFAVQGLVFIPKSGRDEWPIEPAPGFDDPYTIDPAVAAPAVKARRRAPRTARTPRQATAPDLGAVVQGLVARVRRVRLPRPRYTPKKTVRRAPPAPVTAPTAMPPAPQTGALGPLTVVPVAPASVAAVAVTDSLATSTVDFGASAAISLTTPAPAAEAHQARIPELPAIGDTATAGAMPAIGPATPPKPASVTTTALTPEPNERNKTDLASSSHEATTAATVEGPATEAAHSHEEDEEEDEFDDEAELAAIAGRSLAKPTDADTNSRAPLAEIGAAPNLEPVAIGAASGPEMLPLGDVAPRNGHTNGHSNGRLNDALILAQAQAAEATRASRAAVDALARRASQWACDVVGTSEPVALPQRRRLLHLYAAHPDDAVARRILERVRIEDPDLSSDAERALQAARG